MTHGDKADRRRAASVVPTDEFEWISDDEVVEERSEGAGGGDGSAGGAGDLPRGVEERSEGAGGGDPDGSAGGAGDLPRGVEETELPQVPQLRLLVIESAPHLSTAQSAIVAAGHVVMVAAAARNVVEQLEAAAGDLDAVLVGLPGGEPVIEAALALGARRPVVIAASTSGAVEAVRRAAAAGADLATVRPHHVERLAPLLLAAGRLIELRRQLAAPRVDDALQGALDELSEPEPGALQPLELFQRAVELEIERARRYAYPLTLAMFSLDLTPPAPPPALRGILRARAGNALVHAIRDIDLATEIDQDRFLVLLPHTDRLVGADIARRIISAVGAGDPVIAAGRRFAPKVIGAVAGAGPGEPLAFSQLVHDATQLLEQAQETGASLAVET